MNIFSPVSCAVLFFYSSNLYFHSITHRAKSPSLELSVGNILLTIKKKTESVTFLSHTNLSNIFLSRNFARTITGKIKIGPRKIPNSQRAERNFSFSGHFFCLEQCFSTQFVNRCLQQIINTYLYGQTIRIVAIHSNENSNPFVLVLRFPTQYFSLLLSNKLFPVR